MIYKIYNHYNSYNPSEIEPKWQKAWEKAGLHEAVDLARRPKQYILIEFPYPSGERLHVGHGRSYTALDALARKYRMQGFNVLYPMGWDAFGLPAENYAIKTGINPSVTTSQNIKNAKKQAKRWGLSFDWSREINTTDPDYYRWTQWIFLQLLKRGLAYQDEVAVNWCPKCKTNLADEEVLADGTHERCGNKTERRLQKQWLLKITAYADRLLEDLKTVNYLPKIRIQQENWIGKKEGTEIKFQIPNSKFQITIFTTRPETILGATYVALSPNHKLAGKVKTVINPATKKEIPVYAADYVLDSVGTGAIMGVPAYDERDMAFAKEHHLPVVKAKFTDKNYGHKTVNYHLRDWVFSRQHYWGEPIPVVYCRNCARNSTPDSGDQAIKPDQEKIPGILSVNSGNLTYAIVPVPEEDLPVKLPYVENYQPTGTGESPLAAVTEWVKTKCPVCGGPAKRETDTMPNWAGSNWYYVGYILKDKIYNNYKNHKDYNVFSQNKDILNYWLPVDLYNGGMEHTTLHLLYSRFIYKFLFDLDVAPNPEPYARRHSHGTVLGPDGMKMSKSRGNVINPDEVIKNYGADSFRLYEMFMGPFEQTISWSEEGLRGCHRFLKRVWQLSLAKVNDLKTPELVQAKLQATIKKVSSDLENLKFNTAVASMMEFINVWARPGMFLNKKDVAVFLQILAPFAPHISEELWSRLKIAKGVKSIHSSVWPKVEEKKVSKNETAMMIVEVNGKVRDKINSKQKVASSKQEMEKIARASGKIKKYLEGKKVKQVVFVPGRLINFVI